MKDKINANKVLLEYCKKDSSIFTQYVFDYKNAPFHNMWHQWMNINKKGLILSYRGSGKCLSWNTKLNILRNNTWIEINASDVNIGDYIYGWDESKFECVLTKIVDVFDNGIQPIYEIETKQGRKIIVSDNHPFLTDKGWREARDLNVKNWVAVSTNKLEGKIALSKEESRLIGYLLGNGTNTGHTIRFTSKSSAIVEDFINCLKYFNWNYGKDGDCGYFSVTNKSEIHPVSWMKKFELYGKTAHFKQIFSNIFDCNNETLGNIIGAYFDCDGSVESDSLIFYSMSKKLLKQIQTLLLKFNIKSILRNKKTKYNNKIVISFVLDISQISSIKLFYKNIFLISNKKNQIEKILEKNNSEYGELCPTTWIENYLYKSISKKKALRLVSNEIKNTWLNNNITWDRIKSCKLIKRDVSIGIETEHHTLIIDDLITHNSEQLMGRILWEIGNNPNIRIKIATESLELSSAILSKISSTIMLNERFQQIFPEIKPDPLGEWSASKIRVKRTKQAKDPTVSVSGIMTAKTGGRTDLLILDDIAGMRNSILMPKLRPIVRDTVFSNWFPMLDGPDARWWCIGTPWHIEDIVSYFRNNPDIPKAPEVKVGSNFESPWPERHSSDYFKDLLKTYGRIAFNRGYRLVPISSDETWINKDLVLAARDFELSLQSVCENNDFIKFMGVDLGHRSGKENCPTVLFTLALAPNGKRVPCSIKISNDASPLNIARLIINTANELNPALIFVENVGAQQYLVDILKTLGPNTHRIEGYFTSQQKMDLKVGVPSLLAEMESGRWIIPCGDSGDHDILCTCNICKWIGESVDFPNGTSDVLMASWLSLQALRKLTEDNSGGNFRVWTWNY